MWDLGVLKGKRRTDRFGPLNTRSGIAADRRSQGEDRNQKTGQDRNGKW
jgi:hypothetical protein